MIVTYLDIETGRTITEKGISVYSLMEGNWSCDCNRALAFGNGNISKSRCDGCHRYIVVNVEKEKTLGFGGITKEEIIKEANDEYYLNLQAS